MSTIGQTSLNNFYRSVQFSSPAMAELMTDDVAMVALHALSADNTGGQKAAERLRRQAFDLPEIHRRVLDNALTELGYT